MSKEIKLTQGKVAIVDDDDYEYLSKNNWYFSGGYAKKATSRKSGKHTIVRMHRVIMDAPIGVDVDHRDGDKLNNRKENLRLCNRSQNLANKKLGAKNTSGYKGVTWFKRDKKWRAQIKHNRKAIHIGYYDNLEAAAKAYDEKAREFFGEYARVNFP